jgi:hypothetical protein
LLFAVCAHLLLLLLLSLDTLLLPERPLLYGHFSLSALLLHHFAPALLLLQLLALLLHLQLLALLLKRP